MRQMPGTLTCALHATQRGSRPARCLDERDARSVKGCAATTDRGNLEKKHISTGHIEYRFVRAGVGNRFGTARDACFGPSLDR